MNRGFNGIKTVVIALLFLSTVMIMIVPQEGEAGPITQVTTKIDQASQTVDVSPGSTGTVIFSGVCESSTRDPVPIVVTLQASCSVGSATVSPQSFVLNGNDQMALSISVRIPPLTAFNALPQVQIVGTYSQEGSDSVGGSAADVIILQYYKISIECQQPYVEISPGDQVAFSLKIWNYGNGQDTFSVQMENEEELVSAGWTLPPISKQVIDTLAAKTVTLSVQSPQKWTVWQNKVALIKLIVTSENSLEQGQTVKEPYSLFIRTKGVYIPGFEPTFAILALAGLAAMVRHGQIKKKRLHK